MILGDREYHLSMPDIHERNRATLEQIKKILKARRTEYSTVRRQAIIYLQQPDPLVPSDEWRLMYGVVTAVRPSDPAPSPLKLNYAGVIYEEVYLDIDSAIAWLGELIVRNAKIAEHRLTYSDSFCFSHQYDTNKYQRHVDYPCDWFQAKVSEVNSWSYRPLHGSDLPTYPDFHALLHHRFGVEEHSQSWMGEFHILLPAYAVKIEDVAVRKKRVFVKTLMSGSDTSSYELRLWARHGRKHFDHKKTVQGPLVEFRLPEVPSHLAVLLVNTKTGEIVDSKGDSRTLLQVSEKPRSPQQWRKRIQQGEDQDLEFKNYEDYKSGSRVSVAERVKAEDIAKELVAFVNTEGGTVLIGVDDDWVIQGVDEVKKTRAKVIEAANSCDPPITPKLFTIRFGPKVVIGASVEPGKSVHQAGGRVYIRRVETTRKAHSSEIDQIKARLSSPFGLPGHSF
jgi:hypothetical protein